MRKVLNIVGKHLILICRRVPPLPTKLSNVLPKVITSNWPCCFNPDIAIPRIYETNETANERTERTPRSTPLGLLLFLEEQHSRRNWRPPPHRLGLPWWMLDVGGNTTPELLSSYYSFGWPPSSGRTQSKVVTDLCCCSSHLRTHTFWIRQTRARVLGGWWWVKWIQKEPTPAPCPHTPAESGLNVQAKWSLALFRCLWSYFVWKCDVRCT